MTSPDQAEGPDARLYSELWLRVLVDCYRAGMDPAPAVDYANAVLTYLGLAVSNFVQRFSTLVTWEPQGEKPRNTFSRQALQMVWDYAEVNPFASGGLMRAIDGMAAVVDRLPAAPAGHADQQRAQGVDQETPDTDA